jgi:pimeloyl-ACP methyl ester carboxylesterase
VLAQADVLSHLRLATDVAGMDIDEVVLPTEHHLVVGGLRLHYLDWGRNGRSPVVFLHGGCLTAHTWDLVCLALRADFHCLALDQRGHGDSEWSPILDYEPDAHVRDVRGLIEQLGLERPVLVGHSLGGLNAMVYAATAAEKLSGIALVDAGPDPDLDAVNRIGDFVMGEPREGSLEDFVERAQVFNSRRDPRLLRYSLQHNLRQTLDGSLTWKYDRRRLTPEYVETLRRRFQELRKTAQTISCPVLVIRGADSEAFSDEQAAAFAATLPDGRSDKVENAGHTIQGDNPRGLVRVLARFLAEIGH